ncbi:MAG: hypothetical protein KC416_00375 [Myxococcales bacterium]|nr:hypothetical protein [Myxococcales bacterium]
MRLPTRTVLAPLIPLLLAACGSCAGTDAPGTVRQGEVVDRASNGRNPQDHTPPTAPSEVDLAGLVLRTTATRYREVELAIEQHGREVVSLSTRVAVERQQGASWTKVASPFLLRDNCTDQPSPCRPLGPGGALTAPPWLGAKEAAQCDCGTCTPLPAGTYRFVVRSCEGERSLASRPFDLPAPSGPAATTP